MQKLGEEKILYSPSDLVKFLSCHHATVLDFKNISDSELGLKKSEVTSSNRLLQEKGLEHEKNYLQKLKTDGKNVVVILKDKSLSERAELTKKALQAGADVVYQGVLLKENWRGDADFLFRVETPSSFGNFSYEVLDTKLARSAEPKHIIQLCAYTEMLTHLQGKIPQKIHLFLGSQELVSFKSEDFLFYYQKAKQRFEEFAKNPQKASYPEPCQYCTFCDWKDVCEKQWESDDHLSLVANINRSQIEKLCASGVTTVTQLAEQQQNERIKDLNPEIFQRLQSQAALQIHKRKTGTNKCEILPQLEGKGFARIPKADDGDLFFDMEGDPLYPNGLEYLFGIHYKKDGQYVFLPFWAHDHEEEQKTFRDFMEFISSHIKAYPHAHIYHYANYEQAALKRLSCRYGIAEEQVDNLLRHQKFVDLYKVVRESIRVSEPAYSIKNLETFYMEKRDGAVKTAGDSIIIYNEWRETQEPKLLQEIADYNEVDCVSTQKLRDWILTLRPNALPWFQESELQSASDTPPTERKKWEIEYENYSNQLLQNVTDENRDIRQNLVNLLEFHNREAKPQWWAMFERQDKTEDELIDDPECLGGLTLFGNPIPEKRSKIFTYNFPPQEYKLKIGSQATNVSTMKNVGTIFEIDENQCIVKIKTTNSVMPSGFSIGPTMPISAESIRAAIYRVAEDVIQGKNSYPAILSVLKKSIPLIVGIQEGENIVVGGDLQTEVQKAISGLMGSHLFIQGPPGAGKTFTSAHAIVELLRMGKKVGVAANSHKAIHNLLSKIEEVATDKLVNFSGIKKSSEGNTETIFDGKFIQSISKTDSISLAAQLLAGTAWLFSHEKFDKHLDYLFIDEAGQVSVADVVAMGTSAKNIVLVGDQMQLGQPIQGTHPGEAGLSVLEYILGPYATIPPNRGIFLNHTRRLHPSICKFISDAFYDGRLEAHADNLKRSLIFDSPVQDLPQKGIHFFPVHHKGCSQKSSEEVAVLKKTFESLLGQKFQDKDGQIRSLTMDDILVVSPYNVQVNHLRSVLPNGARVGTVDKFQGQEAPVVLISMATSSAEDLPRNIEFLYSKNRMNVAISRAQCLAVVFANPKLVEVPCKTVEQMKLVNTFCWFADAAS